MPLRRTLYFFERNDEMKRMVSFIFVVMLALAVVFYPLDQYYIQKPGAAYPLQPIVKVDGKIPDEAGEFYLMTIGVMKATPFTYLLSYLTSDMKRVKTDQIRSDEESDEEYMVRQSLLMKESKETAIRVAFDQLQKPYELLYEGDLVVSIVEGSAADGILHVGDEIVGIHGERLTTEDSLKEGLRSVVEGEPYTLTIKRHNKEVEVELIGQKLPSENRVGLGVRYMKSETLQTTPAVHIDSSTIGGPSAGLMFTLEVMNQLTDEDLTKGYNIAGTGQIFEDGTVGPIGGIDFKVLSAAREGVDFFFAPHDESAAKARTKGEHKMTNYEVAQQVAKQLETSMKIIPVTHVEDALKYLESLPKKGKSVAQRSLVEQYGYSPVSLSTSYKYFVRERRFA